MPPYKQYVSGAQRRWAHTASGIDALGKEEVEGKDQSSKGQHPPDYVHNGKPESGSLMARAFRKARK
jgi:hypothetical protein